MDKRMIEAAQSGNISVLYELIKNDPYVLEHIDEGPFVDTPLHLAASAGHVDFVMEIMNLKPSFSKKLDQDGFSPMHISLRNEKEQVVRGLLKLDEGLVRVKGREGMTPLHYVVQTGNLNLIIEFLQICPAAIEDMTIRDESVLHVAIKSNKIEAFEVLVRWLQRSYHESTRDWEKKLLSWQDIDGNTVLHLAAIRNLPLVAKVLLENYHYDLHINAKNLEGLTAADILFFEGEDHQVDNRTMNYMLNKAGGLRASLLKPKNPNASIILFGSNISWFQKLATEFARGKKEMSNSMRNTFLVVTVLIITATFEASLNPPSKEAVVVYALFWLYNTIVFWAAVGLTTYLLPSRSISLLLLITLSVFGSCYTFLLASVSFKGYYDEEEKSKFNYNRRITRTLIKWFRILCNVSHCLQFFILVLISYRIGRYAYYRFFGRSSRKIFYLMQALSLLLIVACNLVPTVYVTETFFLESYDLLGLQL